MSSKLLLLFLVLCATQLQTFVHGQKSSHLTGLESKSQGKPYNGVSGGSARHMDEVHEYEKEKGVLIRNKRAAPAPTPAPAGSTVKPVTQMSVADKNKIQKRVNGFVMVFGGLTSALCILCFVNIGLFVWLSIVLKKLKKP
ncbi:unnamed protein product [Caenorhabditis brenneri]